MCVVCQFNYLHYLSFSVINFCLCLQHSVSMPLYFIVPMCVLSVSLTIVFTPFCLSFSVICSLSLSLSLSLCAFESQKVSQKVSRNKNATNICQIFCLRRKSKFFPQRQMLNTWLPTYGCMKHCKTFFCSTLNEYLIFICLNCQLKSLRCCKFESREVFHYCYRLTEHFSNHSKVVVINWRLFVL